MVDVMTDKFRPFSEMQRTLRAGAASGMNVVITFEPDSALYLADILDAHAEALTSALQKINRRNEV